MILKYKGKEDIRINIAKDNIMAKNEKRDNASNYKFNRKDINVTSYNWMLVWLLVAMFLFYMPSVLAQTSSSSYFSSPSKYYGSGFYTGGLNRVQDYQPAFDTIYTGSEIQQYWPILGKPDQCEVRQDFLLNIPPGGCMPGVVRSDLLEEQNVPVFCQVDALKLNPLIDVAAIKSVSFVSGNGSRFPVDVVDVGFHPSRKALRLYNRLLSSPLINNIGYVVVLLKQNPNEKSMPDEIKLNLAARLQYDAENAFGAGKFQYFLPVLDENEWRQRYKEFGILQGKAYLRANYVEADKASISLYRDADEKVNTIVLQKNQLSNLIYIPGYYCKIGVRIALENVEAPTDRVKIQVDNDVLWLSRGQKFLDDNCIVDKIESVGVGEATLRCPRGTVKLSLGLSKKVTLEKVDASGKVVKESKPYLVGERIDGEASVNGDGDVATDDIYLLYVGVMPERFMPGKSKQERTFVLLGKNIKAEYITESGISNSIKSSTIDTLGKLSGDELGKMFGNVERDDNGYLKGISNVNNIIKSDNNEKIQFLFLGVKENEGKAPILSNGFKLKGVGGVVDEDLKLKTPGDKLLVRENFAKLLKEAEEVAREIAEGHHAEANEAGEFYGEKVLYDAAKLAGEIGMNNKKLELLETLTKQYPDSKSAALASVEIEKLKAYDYSNAEADVGLRDEIETHHITLLDVREPTFNDASAKFIISGPEVSSTDVKLDEYVGIDGYLINKLVKVSNKENPLWIKLVELEDTTAKLEFHFIPSGENKQPIEGSKIVKLGQTTEIAGLSIRLQDIKLKKEAIVKVFPELPNSITEANFSVHIGIEKRGIKFSDEKTKEMIANVNESIVKFEKIVTKLGEVVKGMKAVCLATSAGLIVKGLFTNIGGKSLARQQVMRAPGGWNDQCQRLIKQDPSTYPTLDECYRKKASEINKDVDDLADSFKKTNDEIKKLKATPDVQKNADKLGEKYMNDVFIPWVESNKAKTLVKPDGTPDTKTIGQIFGEDNGARIKAMYQDGVLGLEEMKDLVTYSSLSSAGGINKDISNRRITTISEDVGRNSAFSQRRAEFSDVTNVKGLSDKMSNLDYKDRRVAYVKTIDKELDFNDATRFGFDKADKATKYALVTVPSAAHALGSKTLLVPLGTGGRILPFSSDDKAEYRGYIVKEDNNKNLVIDKLSNINGVTDGQVSTSAMNGLLSQLDISEFQALDSKSCEHVYNEPEVKFYETSPYKGLPAVIPVDTRRGWYAATRQTSGIFGGIKPYEESGKVSSFWLCNVGSNGREEWQRSVGDDSPCIQINLDTGQPLDQVPCLERADAQALVRKASRLIQEAASKYGNIRGSGKILLDGASYKVGVPVGAEGTQCQDFMSPNDCYLLFNVCDPVVCPESRCNLGGAYQVDNVIQSGIIGSLALCLPNIREKIFIPICLTGVHAGLDNYVSILKAHRDCLQESLNTGSTVGICDEIKSVYLCEFFWRQIGPLTRVGLPKLIEFATGQGQRGGGEYATISNAFDNAASSLDYMKQVYGPNAYAAFKLRSSDEIGTTICKGFVGQRYPGGKGFLDALTEPDSPTQFTAWFDEVPYTDATVPASSQYKVFYHIFAGRDVGTYYSVYLKNPPESGFYANQPVVVVDTGFIGKGSFTSQTKDFTAPAGYKELCVRVNNKDECGFKKVSTGFALDYLADKYAQEQVSKKANSEQECVSGSVESGAIPIGAGSLQGTAEEAAIPQIYKRGLIRVCSNVNPGQQTTPERWKDVGYCDKNKGISCWLDTESVKDTIKNRNLENTALTDAGKIASELEKPGVMPEEQIRATIESVSGKIDDVVGKVNLIKNADKIIQELKAEGGIINEIEKARGQIVLGQYQARVLELEFRIWEKLIRRYKESVEEGKKTENTKLQITGENAEKPSFTLGFAETKGNMNILENERETGFFITNNKDIYYKASEETIFVGRVNPDDKKILIETLSPEVKKKIIRTDLIDLLDLAEINRNGIFLRNLKNSQTTISNVKNSASSFKESDIYSLKEEEIGIRKTKVLKVLVNAKYEGIYSFALENSPDEIYSENDKGASVLIATISKSDNSISIVNGDAFEKTPENIKKIIYDLRKSYYLNLNEKKVYTSKDNLEVIPIENNKIVLETEASDSGPPK